MTGPELQTLRKSLGLSTEELGRAIYGTSGASASVNVRRLEARQTEIPTTISRFVEMIAERGSVPKRWR